MTLRILTLLSIAMIMMSAGCDKEESTNPVKTVDPGLTSSSTGLSVLLGGDGKAVIGGGTEPYAVASVSNPSIATARMASRELQVSGLAEGASVVKVTDASSPAKSISVNVTVVKSYTAGIVGGVAFTSNRGNFNVNGIGEYASVPPTSGQGAIAMQDFESLYILAYKVNSTTSLDITLIGFQSNTSNYTGTFYYPGSGKVTYISYYPNTNPNDTTFLNAGYLLSGSATAVMESISSTAMKGSFSGNGYYFSNGAMNTSIGFNVTNGLFNVPIVRIDLMPERSLEKKVSRMVKMIMGRTARF
ncbi:MAG: hypothetical protein ACOYNS_09555 [Bacteroidota bacterium]